MLEAQLWDVDTDTLVADLTDLSQQIQVSPRLSRPLTTVLTLPGDTAAIRGIADDGLPVLTTRRRTTKVFRDGVLIANTPVSTIAPTGDENTTSIVITGYDPMFRWQRRWVRDADGNLADPKFYSPISGADILQQVLDNTYYYVGSLPLDIVSGSFDVAVPPAVDLASELTNWPMTIGDLATLLIGTRAIDVVVDPVDHAHLGADVGTVGRLNIVSRYGRDLTGIVHFDYATGDYNVSSMRRLEDESTLCNKLIYYLGPKIDIDHWQGNITATEMTPVDLSAYLALEETSRGLYGVDEDIKVFDTLGYENDARPMYHELWKTEVTLRVNPRTLFYLTPAAGDGSAFKPYDDYYLGDTFTGNLGDIVGPPVAGATQRLFGFDLTQDDTLVERVSELIVTMEDE